jgi:hypothetical protein
VFRFRRLFRIVFDDIAQTHFLTWSPAGNVLGKKKRPGKAGAFVVSTFSLERKTRNDRALAGQLVRCCGGPVRSEYLRDNSEAACVLTAGIFDWGGQRIARGWIHHERPVQDVREIRANRQGYGTITAFQMEAAHDVEALRRTSLRSEIRVEEVRSDHSRGAGSIGAGHRVGPCGRI